MGPLDIGSGVPYREGTMKTETQPSASPRLGTDAATASLSAVDAAVVALGSSYAYAFFFSYVYFYFYAISGGL